MKIGKLTMPYGAGTGKVLTSDSAGLASWATPTGSDLTWQTADVEFSQDLVVGYGYITTYEQDMRLPATAPFGASIAVVGHTAKWRVVQAAGQQIYYGDSATRVGVNGSLLAQNISDSVLLLCVVANTTWRAYLGYGSPITGINGLNGYVGAGAASAGNVATAEKLVFSTDIAAAQTSANLSQARQAPGGVSDGSTKGYWSGGFTIAPVTTAEKITFSNDVTAAQTTAKLSLARYAIAGISDCSVKGYFGGGYSTAYVTNVDTITFSTDTTAANSSALSLARNGVNGVTDGSTKGWWCDGAVSGGWSGTTDKITFSTGNSAAQTTSRLTVARSGGHCASDGRMRGYVAGGYASGPTNVATADRITFSTDTAAAVTTANLSVARRSGIGMSQGAVKGYFSGGYESDFSARGDRIIYSTETTAACTTANLSVARHSAYGFSDVGL